MANLVTELNSLDFSVYIGGPMQAAIKAQHEASMSQVEFIKQVGFMDTSNDGITASDLRYVKFKYNKRFPKEDGSSEEREVTIEVPFLTMLTIPALRIEEMTIDFNAKLTSTDTYDMKSETQGGGGGGVKFLFINLRAAASYKRTTTIGSKVEKTYNISVHVKAVNDEIPAGLERILNMLEDNIASN